MVRQLGLERDGLVQSVECPHSRDESSFGGLARAVASLVQVECDAGGTAGGALSGAAGGAVSGYDGLGLHLSGSRHQPRRPSWRYTQWPGRAARRAGPTTIEAGRGT